MKTSCVINNYNYEEYVINAVESALSQTVPFNEVIIIDDGSTDTSVAALTSKYSSNPVVKIISKHNGGQLSSFHEGLRASTGDILFFLDSDDIYVENYLEEAIRVYKDFNCDFLFSGHEDFNEIESTFYQVYDRTVDLGYSLILATWATGGFNYLGNLTSSLSIKRKFMEKLFPYPFMEDWRIQADFFLVYGSSMAGVRKAYLDGRFVKRRIHQKNLYARGVYSAVNQQSFSDDKLYHKQLRLSRLRKVLMSQLGISESFVRYANNEFRTIPNPTLELAKIYSDIIEKHSRLNFFEKARKKASIYRQYFVQRSKKGRERAKFVVGKPTKLP